jgi:hypothetical protein
MLLAKWDFLYEEVNYNGESYHDKTNKEDF